MPSLSIIIPTHKRSQILKLCIQHLEAQTIADELEVIVVSDGHDDATEEFFAKQTWKIPVQFFEIPKSHQGTARNFGLGHASAPLILFIGDDALLERDACEKHLSTHSLITAAKTPLAPTGGKGAGERGIITAILGHVTWDPACEITPVMRWLEKSGWQFGYPMIAKYAHNFLPTKIQQRFTYTSHISLPTEIARRFPFREDVSLYGWEDIEWGDRLKQAGVRLYYEPNAKALHHHHITLEQSLARMETLGKSLVHMASLSPGFKAKLARWKLMVSRLRSLAPTMGGKHRRAFLRGIQIGKKKFSNQ